MARLKTHPEAWCVRLPPGTADRLRAVVSRGGIGAFIRGAALRELARRERAEAQKSARKRPAHGA